MYEDTSPTAYLEPFDEIYEHVRSELASVPPAEFNHDAGPERPAGSKFIAFANDAIKAVITLSARISRQIQAIHEEERRIRQKEDLSEDEIARFVQLRSKGKRMDIEQYFLNGAYVMLQANMGLEGPTILCRDWAFVTLPLQQALHEFGGLFMLEDPEGEEEEEEESPKDPSKLN